MKRKVTPEVLKNISDMRGNGFKEREIAAELKLAQTTVSVALQGLRKLHLKQKGSVYKKVYIQKKVKEEDIIFNNP